MSVSHPLLKELKGHILDLTKCSEVTEIRDHHPCLLPLCETLENIFKEGFKVLCGAAFGLTRKGYWFWIEQIYREREKYQMPFSLSEAIESVMNSKKVFTTVGRGRLLIRHALTKKLLQCLLACFLEDEPLVLSMYDADTSIIGNEILSEILSSLLHEVSKITFKLELKNSSFLDDTWAIGMYKKYEFVPCKEMGITFGYAQGRAIVVKVEEGSVAAEEDQVEPGDVLEELYGRSLYKCRRGLILSLAHQFQGLPVYLSVIKGTHINGAIYPPLVKLLEKMNLREKVEHKFLQGDSTGNATYPIYKENCHTESTCASVNYDLLLIGTYFVGKEGKSAQVEESLMRATEDERETKEQKVVLEISETKIRIIDKESSEDVICKHFTEVSACGRKECCPEKLAIAIGNTTCTIAQEFHCYVFEAKSDKETEAVLTSIAQGFMRTHWAV